MKNLIPIAALLLVGLIGHAEDFRGGHRPEPPPEVKAAFEACTTELASQGFKFPERGSNERPSNEAMTAMKACLTSAGFPPPERRPAHKGSSSGVN